MVGKVIGTTVGLLAIITVAISAGIWINQTEATAQELKRQVEELKQDQKNLWKRQDVIHLIRTDQALLDQRVDDLDTRQRRIEYKLETGFEKVIEEIRKGRRQSSSRAPQRKELGVTLSRPILATGLSAMPWPPYRTKRS